MYINFIIIGTFILTVFFLIVLIYKSYKNSNIYKTRKKVLNDIDINFDNIITSSFKSKQLYDSLKGKCHPDKFQDEEMNNEATEIFQLLVEHKYNYKKLCELKERAIKNLNIKP